MMSDPYKSLGRTYFPGCGLRSWMSSPPRRSRDRCTNLLFLHDPAQKVRR